MPEGYTLSGSNKQSWEKEERIILNHRGRNEIFTSRKCNIDTRFKIFEFLFEKFDIIKITFTFFSISYTFY